LEGACERRQPLEREREVGAAFAAEDRVDLSTITVETVLSMARPFSLVTRR
jgi:hypothetical protein